MVTQVMHPLTAGPKTAAANMLMPMSYDVAWSHLGDGVFNDYPNISGGAAVVAGCEVGGAIVGYQNPNHSATYPIGSNTKSNIPIVSANPKRTSILMQNNSTASGTDIAPTLYFNFGAQAVVGQCIGLAPGVGLVLDNNVQADALYVTIGPETNTGDSVVVVGAVLDTSSSD